MLNLASETIENLGAAGIDIGKIFIGAGKIIRGRIVYVCIEVRENGVHVHGMLTAVGCAEGGIVRSGVRNTCLAPILKAVRFCAPEANTLCGAVVGCVHGLNNAAFCVKMNGNFCFFHGFILPAYF